MAEPIIANQANKYMWHLWGNPETISGDFKIVGTDAKGVEQPVLLMDNESVWQYADISISPNNGADSHITSHPIANAVSYKWHLEISRLF